MAEQKITPKQLSFALLKKLATKETSPIEGLSIPNIVVPPGLAPKKLSDGGDKLKTTIRFLFNSLTIDNTQAVIDKLRSTIIEKAKNTELIRTVAKEIFDCFIMGNDNTRNYMHLLNAVSKVCVVTPDTETPKTIGYFFIYFCRETIYHYISTENMRKLAQIDQEDSDELDIYNRERSKIRNLILTICYLYEQHKTTFLSLKADHLSELINRIMIEHEKIQSTMKELGNPEIEDCSDEEEYETLNKMSNLYAEILYIIMSNEVKEFLSDPSIVISTQQTLTPLVEKFRNTIVPKISFPWLRNKCEKVVY